MIVKEKELKQWLKWFNRLDIIIHHNLEMIEQERQHALFFISDNEFDKHIRDMCIQEARRLKADNDAIKQRRDDTIAALNSLPPQQKQIIEMFYINGFQATVCCDILGCSKGQFYSWNKKALEALERKMMKNGKIQSYF